MIRKLFFIKKKWFFLIVAIMLFSLIYLSGLLKWIVFFSAVFMLWLHRRREVVWLETFKQSGELYLAPADGEIVRISEWTDPEAGFSYGEIRIKLNYTDLWGLYLPCSSEMEFLKDYPGAKMNRKLLSTITTEESGPLAKTDLVLRSKHGGASRMRFIQCETGKSPKIWMKSGDRGKGAACFGYYPFGGSLIVYVPQPNDILVVEKEKITAGETVLAVVKTHSH